MIFQGWLCTTRDALLVVEGARRGLIPRVKRRFHDLEKRSLIRSGAIVVFTEEESGIKRWTDPIMWSASRMLGNFLIYREKDDKEESVELSSAHYDYDSSADPSADLLDHHIFGCWSRGPGLKEDGLMKKTMSLKVDGETYHMVSYYRPSEVRSGRLRSPSEQEMIRDLEIQSDLLADLKQFRQPPLTRIDSSGRRRYVAEYNSEDSPPRVATPLSPQSISSSQQSVASPSTLPPSYWPPNQTTFVKTEPGYDFLPDAIPQRRPDVVGQNFSLLDQSRDDSSTRSWSTHSEPWTGACAFDGGSTYYPSLPTRSFTYPQPTSHSSEGSIPSTSYSPHHALQPMAATQTSTYSSRSSWSTHDSNNYYHTPASTVPHRRSPQGTDAATAYPLYTATSWSQDTWSGPHHHHQGPYGQTQYPAHSSPTPNAFYY